MKYSVLTTLFFVLLGHMVSTCLITNCPRGGKRNGALNALEPNIKPCISCGPGRLGQCYGANICCGPFGCLIGTPETMKCQREGFFHSSEPCIAGSSSCRKHTGRCAADGICCSQEACHVDRSCAVDEKALLQDTIPMDFYNLMKYPNQIENTAN